MCQCVVWKSEDLKQHLKLLNGLASREEGSAQPVSHDLEIFRNHLKKLEDSWARPNQASVHGTVAGTKLLRRTVRKSSGKSSKVG